LQSGCVIVPRTGAVGVSGCTLIIKSDDGIDVHPAELVTVKLYVPAISPEITLAVPEPVVVIEPGFIINVQFPEDGNPLRTTLPVETLHVG
jgi:hypothetical protein